MKIYLRKEWYKIYEMGRSGYGTSSKIVYRCETVEPFSEENKMAIIEHVSPSAGYGSPMNIMNLDQNTFEWTSWASCD